MKRLKQKVWIGIGAFVLTGTHLDFSAKGTPSVDYGSSLAASPKAYLARRSIPAQCSTAACSKSQPSWPRRTRFQHYAPLSDPSNTNSAYLGSDSRRHTQIADEIHDERGGIAHPIRPVHAARAICPISDGLGPGSRVGRHAAI